MRDEFEKEVRKAIKSGTLNSMAVESGQGILEHKPTIIETTEKLIALDRELLDLLEAVQEPTPEIRQEIECARAELKNDVKELDEIRASGDDFAFLETSNNSLTTFDTDTLPKAVRDDYVAWLISYETSQNSHYLIEIFHRLVETGIAPPKWVLEKLDAGFLSYLKDPARDPKRLNWMTTASM